MSRLPPHPHRSHRSAEVRRTALWVKKPMENDPQVSSPYFREVVRLVMVARWKRAL